MRFFPCLFWYNTLKQQLYTIINVTFSLSHICTIKHKFLQLNHQLRKMWFEVIILLTKETKHNNCHINLRTVPGVHFTLLHEYKQHSMYISCFRSCSVHSRLPTDTHPLVPTIPALTGQAGRMLDTHCS